MIFLFVLGQAPLCWLCPGCGPMGWGAEMYSLRELTAWLVVSALPAAVTVAPSAPGTLAVAQPVRRAASHLPTAGTTHRFIIILRDQNGGLAARPAGHRGSRSQREAEL